MRLIFVYCLTLVWLIACTHAQNKTSRRDGATYKPPSKQQPQNPPPTPNPTPTPKPGNNIPTPPSGRDTEYYTANEIQILKGYCQNQHYEVPGEPVCSRAPHCKDDGSDNYDDVNSNQPDHNKCLSAGERGCGGYIPFCCYVMAFDGDFTKCIGYWERLWCPEVLCEIARKNGASDDQCGGCQCAHAWNHYCGAVKKPLTLGERLP